VGAGAGRPLLEHDAEGTMQLLEARRRPVYRSIADATIDVDWIGPHVAAERAERVARAFIGAR
jgi:shikimate kinase